MRKLKKDIKTLLFENMVKLNSDFKLKQSLNENEQWIQNAVNPEHKGYCTPMSKPTCTPTRKALARRFKKGIENESGNIPISDNNQYKIKVEKLKEVIDSLFKNKEYDILDTLYRLMVSRKSKEIVTNIGENYSSDYQKKIELLKGKIDFLFDTNHFDIIDKINDITNKLFPNNNDPESELVEDVVNLSQTPERKPINNDTYFDTLSETLDAVREKVRKKGFTVDEDVMFNQFGTGGINYGQTKRANIPLLKDNIPDKKRSVTIAIYRMDSGKYELTSYIN